MDSKLKKNSIKKSLLTKKIVDTIQQPPVGENLYRIKHQPSRSSPLFPLVS